MFFIVKYIDQVEFENMEKQNDPGSSPSLPGTNKTLLVNPDCPIGIIRNYIAEELLLTGDNIDTFELCTEKGTLLTTRNIAPVVNGQELLKEKEIYYVVLTPNTGSDSTCTAPKPTPLLNRYSKEYFDLMAQQKRKSNSSKRRASSKDAISIGSVSTKTSL